MFTTRLEISKGTRIIALSDIHGDIDALIIALRDCASVMSKDSINDREAGEYTLETLNLDLNNRGEAEKYKGRENLGFEWTGGDTHVVIIGDSIDNIRQGYTPSTLNKKTGKVDYITTEYPQAELKIILLLNELDKMAIKQGGRVIKLIGNHEAGNFLLDDSENLSSRYSANPDGLYARYYPIENYLRRIDYFKFNNLGFKLFINRGTGVILKINNNIFVHGQLDGKRNFRIYDRINSWLNSHKANGDIDLTHPAYQTFLDLYRDNDGALWKREYGNDDAIDERITDREKTGKFCDSVISDIIKFCEGIECDIANIKVIIGHCPQYNSSISNTLNTTFTKKTESGLVTILEPPGETARIDTTNDFVFGITMECNKHRREYTPNSDYLIYKVDVGTSRAFDNEGSYESSSDSVDNYKKYMLGRTPQVLEINNNKIRIIRSQVFHSVRFQPRNILEEKIKEKGNAELIKYTGIDKLDIKFLPHRDGVAAEEPYVPLERQHVVSHTSESPAAAESPDTPRAESPPTPRIPRIPGIQESTTNSWKSLAQRKLRQEVSKRIPEIPLVSLTRPKSPQRKEDSWQKSVVKAVAKKAIKGLHGGTENSNNIYEQKYKKYKLKYLKLQEKYFS
jgi:hypothetical protein